MPIGAAIGTAAVGVGKAALGQGAADAASHAAEQAAANTNNYVKGVYSTAGTNLSPQITAGGEATGALAGLLGIGGNPTASANAFKNYLGSTNYQFMLNQGLQGVQYANAPSFNSSATAKALNNYAQGMAGNALQGYEGLLQGQSQLGAQSALGLGQIGMAGGNIINSANQGLASTQGQASVYGATGWGNALNDVLGAANQARTQSSFGGGGGGGSYNFANSMNALNGISI